MATAEGAMEAEFGRDEEHQGLSEQTEVAEEPSDLDTGSESLMNPLHCKAWPLYSTIRGQQPMSESSKRTILRRVISSEEQVRTHNCGVVASGVFSLLAVVVLATWLCGFAGRPRVGATAATLEKDELALAAPPVVQPEPAVAPYTPAPARLATAPWPMPSSHSNSQESSAGVFNTRVVSDAGDGGWPSYAPSPPVQTPAPSSQPLAPSSQPYQSAAAAPTPAGPSVEPMPAPHVLQTVATSAYPAQAVAPPSTSQQFLQAETVEQVQSPATATFPPVAPSPATYPQQPLPPQATASQATATQAVPAMTAPRAAPAGIAAYVGVEAGVPGCSLFCYALMLPGSYEQALLTEQRKGSVSLFACDEYALYSSKAIEVTEGLWTNIVDSDLKCKKGGEFKTALNTPIFLAVWRKVVSDGRYLYHDWTVKTDPDTVFIPTRLRSHLKPIKLAPSGVYLNNCKFGLHGPLEVFSRNAVTTWSQGIQRCVSHFNRVCSGPCLWGEDMFIDQCLMKVLGVARVNEYFLLQEDHCDPPYGWKSCQNASIVAFHPFKDPVQYNNCLSNAIAVDVPSSVQPAVYS